MTDAHEPERDVSDEELLEVLAAVLERTDPVPADLVAAASAALTWRTIDAELAELLYDSAVDPEPVLVRELTVARLLAFAGAALSVDVELQGEELVGSLSPPGPCAIELQQPAGSRQAESDDAGMFRLTGVQRGPARLVVRDPTGGVVATPWVVL
jgi:hypothetical protein